MTNTDSIVDELFDLLINGGGENYSGEQVTQLEHMAQTAELVRNANCRGEVLIAALFHDIGHILSNKHAGNDLAYMGSYGVVDHEKIGAAYMMKLGFSDEVSLLIESHVPAKRYLTYKDENYKGLLSPASLITLSYQGGEMTEAEAIAFENKMGDLLNEALLLRRCEEDAKVPDMPLPDWDYYKQLCKAHLEG